jgi:O-antigen ligase
MAVFAAYIVTGPELQERFLSAFAEQRDYSAQSRLDLWRDTLVVIREHPLFGAGPDHFPLVAADFGWPAGKEAHSLWLQLAAEIGLPGVVFLVLFYVSAVRRVWPLVKFAGHEDSAVWARTMGLIVVASLAGFAVSAQFVTLEGLEAPLYIVVLAVGVLRTTDATLQTHVASRPRPRGRDVRQYPGTTKLRNHSATSTKGGSK